MATGSPDKKQTKRSMIHIVPASSSYRRFVSRRKISMMIPLALFSRAVFLFFMPFSSWCISSGSMDLSLRIHDIEVVAEFPHDPQAFTQRQGLLYAGNDTLYKSTGLYGKSLVIYSALIFHLQSSLRKVALRTGKVEFLEKMGDSYFGEGLTLLGERLFQVAWLTNTGFSYDLHNLREVKPFKHQMKDGWGLATDGEVLFGSDGTSTLYRMDPHTMKIRYNGREVRYLNALEYINKEVWANVWQSDCIARISPKDGSLLGWILFPQLSHGKRTERKTNRETMLGIEKQNRMYTVVVEGLKGLNIFTESVLKVHEPSCSQEICHLFYSSYIFGVSKKKRNKKKKTKILRGFDLASSDVTRLKSPYGTQPHKWNLFGSVFLLLSLLPHLSQLLLYVDFTYMPFGLTFLGLVQTSCESARTTLRQLQYNKCLGTNSPSYD